VENDFDRVEVDISAAETLDIDIVVNWYWIIGYDVQKS
jgi:hypothetical protein